MKQAILLIIISFYMTSFVKSQSRAVFSNPEYRINYPKGYANISEINTGSGIGKDRSAPYGKYYFGITNISAYQIEKNLLAGIGTGIFSYNGGFLIPLFLDFRYNKYFSHFTPFIMAEGGLLIDPDNIDSGTRIFINPGMGIIKAVSRNLLVSFNTGILSQTGSFVPRASFINFRIGVIYKSR